MGIRMPDPDPYSLGRFVVAQEPVYKTVLAELRAGAKRSHWMWFIFPQIEGLGQSPTSKFYSIKSLDESRRYLAHPVLGPRLLECAETVLTVKGRSALEILGSPDDLKLKSSMTLFASVAGAGAVFSSVLDKYFDGEQDQRTLQLLARRQP
jgi:uncharacterized protein (DUF1810 family)